MTHEARIREQAHQLWVQEGKPEGRELAHWHEAERQVRAEAGDEPVPTLSDHGWADPLRNPVLIPPAEDPEYPAITGPVEVPAGVSRAGLNPSEVFEEGKGPGSTGEPWSGNVPVRQRSGNSTLEP